MRALFTSTLRRRAAACAIVSLLLQGAVFSTHATAEAPFQHAFNKYTEAITGNSDAVAPAADEFMQLLQADPANPVLIAYAGSSTALKASTTILPWKKMAFAEDGLAMLDKSLALLRPQHDAPIQHGTPGSLEVRFVAATTFLAVPSFMNRGARGAKLLADVLASPLFAQSPLFFRGNVWMRAASLAAKEQRGEESRRYLNEVIFSNAPQAVKARALLKGPSA